MLTDAGEVAAPPAALHRVVGDLVPGVRGAAAEAAHALDDDQPVRVHRVDRVADALGRELPVAGGVAAAPAGAGRIGLGALRVRLVEQVGADDGRVAGVALGEHLPVRDHRRLGDRARVPERRLAGGRRTVAVEDHAHAEVAGVVDDLVEDLQRRQADQVRVREVVDPGGAGVGPECVARVGDAQGVEAELGHVVELVAPGRARPEPVERLVVRLHAEPVDAGELHLGAGRVDDPASVGVQVTGARAAGRCAHGGGRGGGGGGCRGGVHGGCRDDSRGDQGDPSGQRREAPCRTA